MRLQQFGEGAQLLAILPGGAAAVALQRVVEDVVVVRVLASQDAGSARAAQRTGHKLREREVEDEGMSGLLGFPGLSPRKMESDTHCV